MNFEIFVYIYKTYKKYREREVYGNDRNKKVWWFMTYYQKKNLIWYRVFGNIKQLIDWSIKFSNLIFFAWKNIYNSVYENQWNVNLK